MPFHKVSDFNLNGNERFLVSCTNWVSRSVAAELGAKVVPRGSVLLPKVGAALLGNARRITTTSSVFDNNVLAIVPNNIESRYLHYWLGTTDAGVLANPGPVPSLSNSDLLDLRVPVSDQATQRAIADYLDTETARIDALITKKRPSSNSWNIVMCRRLLRRFSAVHRQGVRISHPQRGRSRCWSIT